MPISTNTSSTTTNFGAKAGDALKELSNRLSNVTNSVNTLSSSSYSYDTTTTAAPYWSDAAFKITIPDPSRIWIDNGTSNMPEKSLEDYFKEFAAQDLANLKKETEKSKEKSTKMNMFGQFGPVTDGSIALSIKGMAVKSPAGKYVAYDANSEEMFDVDILSIKTKAPIFFKMPVAIADISMGDIIVHNDSHYCFVLDGDGKQFTVIDITTSEQRIILPQKSPFGFNFVTKVISLVDSSTANAETPFGNMLPYVMMNGDMDMRDMLPMLMLSNSMGDISKNPMLMYMLMKDGGMSSDILPFILMMKQ